MLTIPEDMFPQVYLRYALASIFVFLTPGFCLIKALFPIGELDNFEMAIASIATSLATVTLIAFLLNLTPSGINPATISVSILPFTIMCATVGLVRARTRRIPAHMFA